MMEKRIPSNIAAEEALLGCLLERPWDITKVVDVLVPDDFRVEAHISIFEAMLILHQSGRRCTLLNVKNELERRGRVLEMPDFFFWESYLEHLSYSLGTLDPVEDHAQEIKKTGTNRKLYAAAAQIAEAALRQDENALEMAEQLITSIALGQSMETVVSLSTMMSEYIDVIGERMDNFKNHVANGVPTGFRDLDALVGGLQKAELVILAARPSIGKTATALNIALNIVRHSRRVLFFSLEMRHIALSQRLIAMETPIDQSLLRDGDIHDDEFERVVSVAGDLAPLDMHVDDRSRFLSEIKSKSRRLHSIKPLNLIVVDYLQLIQLASDGKGKMVREEVVAQISRELKELAMELDVPVLALAQLNRAIESRANKTPMLSDLRESGAVEQNADIVMFLHCEDAELDKRNACQPYKLDIIVGKNRNGPIGTTEFIFRPRSTKLENVPTAQEVAYENYQPD